MTILNRYNKKALQQICRNLHIATDGNKETVVRRLAAHMVRDYVQLAAEDFGIAAEGPSAWLGMSQYFRSEGYPTS